jgi:hypothetical protein
VRDLCEDERSSAPVLIRRLASCSCQISSSTYACRSLIAAYRARSLVLHACQRTKYGHADQIQLRSRRMHDRLLRTARHLCRSKASAAPRLRLPVRTARVRCPVALSPAVAAVFAAQSFSRLSFTRLRCRLRRIRSTPMRARTPFGSRVSACGSTNSSTGVDRGTGKASGLNWCSASQPHRGPEEAAFDEAGASIA